MNSILNSKYSNDCIPGPIAKSRENKKVSMQLIMMLIRRDDEIFMDFNRKISEEQKKQNKEDKRYKISSNQMTLDDLEYSPYSFKSETGFVGIRNPGCLCYMISSLQQLYMIPQLRKQILSMNLKSDEVREQHYNFIKQFQKTICYLQESKKRDIDISNFTKFMKGADGDCIDPLVQQDAGEFLCNFFQQLENALCGTNYQSVIKDTFGFETANELLVAEKDKDVNIKDRLYSIRSEENSLISVEVEGFENLNSSLANFIKEDQVDYTWEYENKKYPLPTLKRTCLKTLPNNLIIHLKRFTYDFNTFASVKINSRFEFPHELNMKPYTLSGRNSSENSEMNEEDYIYTLSGIVVHSGSTQGGHYTSYIRNRVSMEKEQWFEFNDSRVDHVKKESIVEKCFGGKMEYSSNHYYSGMEKCNSAFLLFYEKKRNPDCFSFKPILKPDYFGSSISDRRIEAERDYALQQSIKAEIPPEIMREIEEDNKKFYKDTQKSMSFINQLSDEDVSAIINKLISINEVVDTDILRIYMPKIVSNLLSDDSYTSTEHNVLANITNKSFLEEFLIVKLFLFKRK